MAIKYRFHLTVFFFFLLAVSIFAQVPAYFMETEGGETRFIQRLSWVGTNALRYEVKIQSMIEGKYAPYFSETTTELFLEVNLHPGNYRFSITPYDVLNRPGTESDWHYIQVLHATGPDIERISTEYYFGNKERRAGFILSVWGRNFQPNAQITIRGMDGISAVPEAFFSDDGSILQLFIERDAINPGIYELVIKNPGGLETRKGGITLFPEEVTEVIPGTVEVYAPLTALFTARVGGGWAPMQPVYGSLYGNFSPLGMQFHLSFFSFDPSVNIHIGTEFTLFRRTLDHDSTPFRDMIYHVDLGFNLLMVKWLANERAALGFKAGMNLPIDATGRNSGINLGGSFHWRVLNKLLLEAGLDHIFELRENTSGFFRPWVGVSIMVFSAAAARTEERRTVYTTAPEPEAD